MKYENMITYMTMQLKKKPCNFPKRCTQNTWKYLNDYSLHSFSGPNLHMTVKQIIYIK